MPTGDRFLAALAALALCASGLHAAAPARPKAPAKSAAGKSAWEECTSKKSFWECLKLLLQGKLGTGDVVLPPSPAPPRD